MVIVYNRRDIITLKGECRITIIGQIIQHKTYENDGAAIDLVNKLIIEIDFNIINVNKIEEFFLMFLDFHEPCTKRAQERKLKEGLAIMPQLSGLVSYLTVFLEKKFHRRIAFRHIFAVETVIKLTRLTDEETYYEKDLALAGYLMLKYKIQQEDSQNPKTFSQYYEILTHIQKFRLRIAKGFEKNIDIENKLPKLQDDYEDLIEEIQTTYGDVITNLLITLPDADV